MVRWSSVVSSTDGFPIHSWFSADSTLQNTAWYPVTTPIRSLQSNFQDTFMDRFLTTSTLTVFNLPILLSGRIVQVAQTMPEEEVWVLADTANWYTLLSGKLTFRESLVLGTTSQANWPSHWNTKENQNEYMYCMMYSTVYWKSFPKFSFSILGDLTSGGIFWPKNFQCTILCLLHKKKFFTHLQVILCCNLLSKL